MSREMHWLTATEAVAALRDGELDLEEYVEALLERSARLEHLKTYVTHDPDLVRESLGDKARLGAPLQGLPFALKDIIDTADLPTTATTPALRDWRPSANAPIAQALLDAGGTLMGKQAAGELSFGMTGNSGRFGRVGNPYDADYLPGGSSSGTGAGVAAGLVPVALGADTGGSCRIPAALCGCVGFRPSHGRYDQQGIIPISSTRDTAGPLARSVADVRLVDGICAPDTGGSADSSIELSDLRLGVPRAYFYDGLDPDVEAATEDALSKLSERGATLVEADLEGIAELNERVSFPLVLYEVLREFSAYLYQHGSSLTVREVVAEIDSAGVKATLEGVLDADQIPAAVYREALVTHRPALQAAYADYFAGNDVRAIVVPTTPLPARPHKDQADEGTVDLNGEDVDTFFTYIRNTDPPSNAGLPCLSIPSGRSGEGMPIGLELVGPAGADAELLAIGEAVEASLPPLERPEL
jgi:indoleacetamide hydrolase